MHKNLNRYGRTPTNADLISGSLKTQFSQILLIIFLILPMGVSHTEGFENGFHLIKQSGLPSEVVSCQNEGKHFLGEKQQPAILESRIVSQDNANKEFIAFVKLQYAPDLERSTYQLGDKHFEIPVNYILIIDGNAWYGSGSTSSDSASHKSSHLRISIMGQENAVSVAKYLDAPVLLREHPRHNLLVSFTPLKGQYITGEKVQVKFLLANIGTEPFSFLKGGHQRGTRDNQYVFSAELMGEQVKDISTSGNMGGLCVPYLLAPGEILEETIDLNKWFTFDAPGYYSVLGSYLLNFLDPSDRNMRTVWEDYATAKFYVYITEKK